MRSLGFIYSLFFIHRYIDSLLGYPKILMVLVTEPHLRYSLSAFNTCFLEYISQFLSVPVRVQVFVRPPPPEKKRILTHEHHNDMLYYHFELTFSETIFLLFTSLYFLMTYFGVGGEVWEKYSSCVLLLLIIIAVLLNAWLDHALIPLETLRPGEREALHMTAILYILIIFAYIKFGYKNDNYDSIIQYFILLMIGRFVGFDTTINAMQKTFHSLVSSLPLLAMALASTGVMAYVEFSIHYLVTPNGVVFNLFIARLYLLVIMSIVYTIRSSFWKKADTTFRS